MSPDGVGGAAERRKPVKLPAPGRASEEARRLKTDICDIPGLIQTAAVAALAEAAAEAAAAAGLEASDRKLEQRSLSGGRSGLFQMACTLTTCPDHIKKTIRL